MEQIRCTRVGAGFVHQLLRQPWQGTGQAVQANLLCIVALQCICILDGEIGKEKGRIFSKRPIPSALIKTR